MRRNFLEYASYTILDRALPDLRDGCKPVQRRLLHTLFTMDDGLFHKVANVIGETMKLHPHGDVSIGDALVVLANKDYFVERQGNFGNPITGHPAAASRYIECRLTPLARDTLFNPNLTEFVPSYDGRRDEPVFLPAKLPVTLLLGIEGIAVGMATRILPHNFVELLRAQIAILSGEKYKVVPDFPTGGLMDVSEYDKGRGKVKVRAQHRGARREDRRDPRDPLRHHHRVADRLDRGRVAEGPREGQRHRRLHHRQGRDRALARARRVRRRSDPAALRLHRVRGLALVVGARDPRPEAGRADRERGARGRDRAAARADQGRARVGRAPARRPPALDDARARVHREPRLQEDRDREDRGEGVRGRAQGHGRVPQRVRARHDGRRREAPARDPHPTHLGVRHREAPQRARGRCSASSPACARS